MEPGTILAITSLILQTLDKISALVTDARHFKPECQELGAISTALKIVIEKNRNALTTHESCAKLQACVADVEVFIEQCTRKWNLWKHAREVFFDHRLPQLRQNLIEWIAVFTLEDSAIMTSNLRSMEDVLRGQNDDIQFIRNEMEAEAKQRHAMSINRTPAVKIDFSEKDDRLEIMPDGSGFSGTFEGRSIVLADVNADEMKIGRNGSRHVEIYKRISVGALVQSFYGICELNGKKYAVLEDLRNEPTLAVAVKSGLLPKDSSTRQRIAYDLANTVAYFHSVGILIKSLSDDTVVLRRVDGGNLQPCLTNLETARMILEQTSLIEYDVRFEAPEYPKQSIHTKHTDVWSLGTIVWECIAGSYPFSTPSTAPENKNDIRSQLAKGILPWNISPSQESDPVHSIVRDCWNANPALRPSAAFVAQNILDILVRQLVGAPPTIVVAPYNVLHTIKVRVLERIKEKKEGKKPVPAIVLDDARVLRQSADLSVDPVSSFLLGSAILYGLIPAHMYDQGEVESATIDPPPEVKRMREARKYLEMAVDAGVEEALHECGKAYHMLAKHYIGK